MTVDSAPYKLYFHSYRYFASVSAINNGLDLYDIVFHLLSKLIYHAHLPDLSYIFNNLSHYIHINIKTETHISSTVSGEKAVTVLVTGETYWTLPISV